MEIRAGWKLTDGRALHGRQQGIPRCVHVHHPGRAAPTCRCSRRSRNDYNVNDVSGKIGLDYSGIEHTLIYGSVSRGFKSGGFQGQLTFDPTALQPFKDENLVAYEVGMKTRMLGNTLQLNASAFFYDYKDMQFYGGLFDSPVGMLFGITNVGDAEVKGGELDLWWKPAHGLDVRLGLGPARHEDHQVDRRRRRNRQQAAQLTRHDLQCDGPLRMADLGLAAWRMCCSRPIIQDDVRFDVVRDPPEGLEGSYWLTNARIGIGSADGRWNVSVWGKNLADERYRTQVMFSSVGFGSSYGPPRTYGVGFMLKM